MKFIKLTAISAAVMASTAAFAAEPVIVVDDADAMVYEAEPVAVAYEAEPVAVAYEAEPTNTNTGIVGKTTGAVRNTTGAIFGGTKTLFQTAINPASVSAEAGTLGYGASVGYSLNEKTELQAGWAGGDAADLFGGDFDADDVNYEVDSDFSNPYLGVQLRPASNWFTVGAGIIVPDNDIDVRANAEDGSYKIDNVTYSSADVGTLEGTIEHRNKLAPYATIGFRPNITNNFGVFGELGAAYMGKTDATVTASGTSATAIAAAEAAEDELEDKDWLEWMPIVKVGATYRF
ncbi:hypothetical protein I6E61_04735 [Psychrobacter sp. NZS113]|uniref:hypothetical protein n=1 Tax=Psychrobacter sp. NZS113 TaxID=2792045 RepID=UPI0018CF857C|nr:hypothetical protein [Psychrobacter sp. NZS113]MBH0095690.1 hypothetical protein [Psychrobacter sp. NZS113]